MTAASRGLGAGCGSSESSSSLTKLTTSGLRRAVGVAMVRGKDDVGSRSQLFRDSLRCRERVAWSKRGLRGFVWDEERVTKIENESAWLEIINGASVMCRS